MARGVVSFVKASAEGQTDDQRLEWMFRIVLGRPPEPTELADARQFLMQPGSDEQSGRPESAAWQYGYGELDKEAGVIKGFTALPYFSGTAWQGGSNWPDATLGWVQLTATGGHAGNDLQHAAVRRWTAPRDGTMEIRSVARHEVPVGDGVRCSLVARRGGVLQSSVVHHGQVEFNVPPLAVQKGDTIDFVIDYNADLNNDQFLWSPNITLTADDSNQPKANADGDADAAAEPALPLTVWQAERDFAGPAPDYLDPWEQLAQVLLLSNELVFVD